MAYTKKTADVSSDVAEVKKDTKPQSKKFEQDDLIPCRSMVCGKLFVKGARSGLLYTFADYDDVCDIEYRDLIYMVRLSKNKTIYEPRIIVEDDDFIAQNPKLGELYETMYTEGDLYEIMNLPTAQMVSMIKSLPNGCKVALKGIISTMIDDGSLDSIQKIKALDELFGTNMLLTLAQE